MRIATWNINGLRARIDYIGHYLEQVAPDLIGLQELKMTDELFPHDRFTEKGYRALVHGQKAWNGVAILAKEERFKGEPEPEILTKGLPGQEHMGARLIGARFGELAFYTAYCPNGKKVEHDLLSRRPETLDVEEFIALTQLIQNASI